jgi:DNA-binding GntR family transcriptional regulator
VRDALAAEDPVARFLEHDFRLHDYFIHASRNGRLIRMLATLRSQVSLFQIRDTGYPRRMERALDDHERILQALIAGQTEAAAEHLANHIDNSRDGVLTDIFHVPAEAKEGERG